MNEVDWEVRDMPLFGARWPPPRKLLARKGGIREEALRMPPRCGVLGESMVVLHA
jgi:hypothetical protein